MDKDFKVTFTQCPNCGSERRFCEELGKETKAKGLARPEWNFAYDLKRGAAIDQSRAIVIPIGGTVPGFLIKTDICMDCGTIYATDLIRQDPHIEVKPQGKLPFKPRVGLS